MQERAAERLDDLDLIANLDPSAIYSLTEEFPSQCEAAIRLGGDFDLSPFLTRSYDQVLLAGVGGSATAGDYLQAVFGTCGTIPLIVSRSYTVPSWVGQESLVLCSSYSGDTEETLSAYESAKSMGAHVLAVTSGGELAKRCRDSGDAVLRIPGGQPPRTALGYSFLTMLFACKRLGFLPGNICNDTLPSFLWGCVKTWGTDARFESNQAKNIAATIHGSIPVCYGLGPWQGAVASRWKAQFNENAKAMAFANTIPELNHNEILGWTGIPEGESWSCIVLEDGSESPKMQARANFTLDVVPKRLETTRVQATGTTLIEKMLSLTLLGDYVSLYLSTLRGVDPGDISLLSQLKDQLSNVD